MAGVFHEIAPTFAGGELTPAMYSRVDMAKYKTALRTGRNGFVKPQGGFYGRTGFRYVAATKFSNRKCRLIEFEFSSTQSYMLEVGHLYIRFYTNGGQIMFGGLPYEIATPYQESELPLLKWTESANTMYFAHPNHRPQVLVRVSDTNWTLSDFIFRNGPYMLENSDPTSAMTLTPSPAPPLTVQGNLHSSAAIFLPGHVGSWFKAIATNNGTSATQSVGTPGNTGPSGVMSFKQWKVATTGTWDGTIEIRVTITGGGQRVIATLTSHSDANYNTFGDLPYDVPVPVSAIAFLNSGTVNITLSADAFTFGYDLQIFQVISATDAAVVPSVDSGFALLNFTTIEWSEGSWSSVRGWPSVVSFYQDRLGWAATLAEPVALWLSQDGDYANYGVSDPLVDSDGISTNLPSRKFNGINNLIQLRKFVALSSSGEFSIGPGSSGVLAPTSIDQRQEGFRGCSTVNPIVIGYQGIYIQPRGTVVRNISFQFYTDTMAGDHLSLMANHLFENYTILDMTYCQEPDSLAYLVRSDGQLLVLTYLVEQQVIGWTHFDTNGSFESCASIPTSNYDELWVVVNRPFGRFIERLAQPLPTTNVVDQFHVDCGIDYNGAPTTGISGLDHLNGQSVMVLGDGTVQGPFIVTGGSITLPTAVSIAHIGLSYTVDLETLNVELVGQDGTSQGRRQRVAQLTVRFLNSLGGYWGPSATKLHPIVPAPPPSLGSPRPLFSGDQKAPITPDWKTNGRVFLRQTDPLPFNVTGLFPVVESGNL